MRKKYGMSFIEILVALIILTTAVMALYSILWRGLMLIKRGKTITIATNLAQGQFEAYENKFHMIPFYQGTQDADKTYYPDSTNQTGLFVNHNVQSSDLPAVPAPYSAYYGIGSDFYHTVALGADNYDLNKDGIANDLIEPLAPITVDGIKFIPVVEIRAWTNGFNINEIKHIVVTVYWQEKDVETGPLKFKHITFEGYIVRTELNPW